MLFSKKAVFLLNLDDLTEIIDFKHERTDIFLEKSAVIFYLIQAAFTFAKFINFPA